MAKAESKERGKDRSYPCPLCRSDHTSVTTYLGMIASRPLMSWMGKNGIAKLNVLADVLKEASPDTFQPLFEIARTRWESQEDTQFWKSAKQTGQDAADIGTMVHGWIEAHINGKEVTMETFPPQAQAAIKGFIEWEKANHVEYLSTEQTFYHCSLDYAGTADCVAKVNGELSMIDWKTAKGVYANYVVQDWLYALADEHQHGDRLYRQVIIGRFGKDGNWEAPIFKRNDPIGIELAREVIVGCRSIFKMNQAWDKLFPWTPKKKEGKNASSTDKIPS
jgi:hypothetical protein